MSRYLVRRIEDNPAIVLRTRAEIVALEGDRHVERVRWCDNRTSALETNDVAHVFVMTGAVPNTSWLDGCVVLDERGFIKTGAVTGGTRGSGVAAPTAALSARNESSGRFCGRRRTGRQRQARGLRRRRGINGRRLCSSSASRVKKDVMRGQGWGHIGAITTVKQPKRRECDEYTKIS